MMDDKGGFPMLIFVVAIVLFLISGALYAGTMKPVLASFAGYDSMDKACPKFCGIQTDVEGLTGWNIIGLGDGQWLGRKTTSEVALDKLKGNIDPEAMGCFCGVSEREGKYIHMYGHVDEARLEEFHITKHNPRLHLNYYANKSTESEFNHSSNPEKCQESLKDEFSGLKDLNSYEGCIIFSIQDESEECTIYGYEEGSALWNVEGENIRTPMHGSSESLSGIQQNSPIFLSIGDRIEIGGDRPNYQRLLLKRYWEGTQPFELYAPVVCKSETSKQEPQTKLDEVCNEYCSDEGKAFWSSKCSDTVMKDSEELPKEYINEEDELCPEENEKPQCTCVLEKEYYWSVEEGYHSEEK